jgi:hypothetical protein
MNFNLSLIQINKNLLFELHALNITLVIVYWTHFYIFESDGIDRDA